MLLANSVYSPLKTLFLLKTKILSNNFKSWATPAKLLATIIAVFFTIAFFLDVSNELLNDMFSMPLSKLLIEWLFAYLIIFVLFILFIFDLIRGHVLNSGQMSSDFDYLKTLPINPLSIMILKLFESLATDYVSIITIVFSLIGIFSKDQISIFSILMPFVIYFQVALIKAVFHNFMLIFLRRFFKKGTVQNIFSVLSFVSFVLFMVPFFLFEYYPEETLYWIIQNESFLVSSWFNSLLIPFKYLACFIAEPDSVTNFYLWSIFWLSAIIPLFYLFNLIIQKNWLDYSHSNVAVSKKKKGFFKGFFRKELLLLKSDFNILVNAIFLPLTFTLINMYLFLNKFQFVSFKASLNIAFSAVIYFCLFGPINSIGSEGKATAILDTLPISPSELIFKKSAFWLAILMLLFTPVLFVMFYYNSTNLSYYLYAFINLLFFSAACVFCSVCISAISANYEAKVMQQSSSALGKLQLVFLLPLLVSVKSLEAADLYNIVLFLSLLFIFYIKACRHIYYRIDRSQLECFKFSFSELLLPALLFSLLKHNIDQLFIMTVSNIDTNLWEWAISTLLFLPISLFFISNRSKDANALINCSLSSKESKKYLYAVAAVLVFSVILYISNTNIFKLDKIVFHKFMGDIIRIGFSTHFAKLLTALLLVVLWQIYLFIYNNFLFAEPTAIWSKIISCLLVPLLLMPEQIAFFVFALSSICLLLRFFKATFLQISIFSSALLAAFAYFELFV